MTTREQIEELDSLLRVARDLRMTLDLRQRLEEVGGVVDLAVLETEERISTKLSEADMEAIDRRIEAMINNLVTKAIRLKGE